MTTPPPRCNEDASPEAYRRDTDYLRSLTREESIAEFERLCREAFPSPRRSSEDEELPMSLAKLIEAAQKGHPSPPPDSPEGQ